MLLPCSEELILFVVLLLMNNNQDTDFILFVTHPWMQMSMG